MVKHAGAAHASIVLARKQGSVLLMIEDDGRGFESAERGSPGLGLLGIRERVDLLDGTFRIETAPGAGTTLIVELPVPQDPA